MWTELSTGVDHSIRERERERRLFEMYTWIVFMLLVILLRVVVESNKLRGDILHFKPLQMLSCILRQLTWLVVIFVYDFRIEMINEGKIMNT